VARTGLNVVQEFFVDTNVLVYAYDKSAGKKHEVARKIVGDVFDGKKPGVVSNQVLAELFSVLTGKTNRSAPKEQAASVVRGIVLSPNWAKIDYSSQTVVDAALLCGEHGNHFWDCLIAQTMLEHGIEKILTENAKDFNIPQIVAEDPFKQ